MTQPTPPPGWYPDPSGAPGQRYWDGRQWGITAALAGRPVKAPQPNTKRTLLVIGAIAALFVLGSVFTFGEDKPETRTSTPTSRAEVAPIAPPAPELSDTPMAAPAGAAVRDGKFEFVVDGVRRSSERTALSEPKGEWVIVTMTVTNIGDRAQTFFPGNQKLVDAHGREYEADTMAAYGMNDDVIMELNPGLGSTIDVPFDVPPGTQLSVIELHDSAFSGGVAASLAS